MNPSAVLAAALVLLQSPPVGREDPGGERREDRPIPAPPARAPVAGLQGFDGTSTITFPDSPERPHRLRTSYVFPDRVRWQLTVGDEQRGGHETRYRYGDRFFLVREGSRVSEECTGEERSEMLLAMELRRALLSYPHGFEWKESGDERRAELGEFGALLLRPDSTPEKKPAEMRAVTRGGKEIDHYKGIVWREKDGRSWPSSFELWRSGVLVWRETIESIDLEGRLIDAFFLPVDRRVAVGTAMPVEEVRTQELPATCALRVEVPRGTPWPEVAAGYARLLDEWTQRLGDRGLGFDRLATVEVGAKGEPVAWIVRLDPVPERPPSEFTAIAARRGVALAVRGLASVTPEKVAQLSKSLPPGATAGVVYVRFDPGDGGSGTVLIALPYSASKGS